MQNEKPKVNFWRSYGCIASMLVDCRDVLSPKKYLELTQAVNNTTNYKEQIRIFERYVIPYITNENKVLSDKVRYLDVITNSHDAIPVTVIAKDYGVSPSKFNMFLHFIGIQYFVKSCGTWVLFGDYEHKGYTVTKTFVYDKKNDGASIHTYWTQKGRLFLYDKLKEYGVVPVCEGGYLNNMIMGGKI